MPEDMDEIAIVDEHQEVVRGLCFRALGGCVHFGEERRTADVHEIPADAEQEQRDPEIEERRAAQRDRRCTRDSSTIPARMMLSTPKRLMSDPVKNEGPYIPIMCHCSTNAASLKW